MKRLAQVSYKPKGKKVVTENIWIQNFPVGNTDNHILMQLFIDKDTDKPVINTNQNGEKQYQVSIYGTECYAYVPINAVRALKALGLAKSLNGQVWVKLPLTSIVPSMEDFNNAPAYK